MKTCPKCNTSGRAISAVTLRAQLKLTHFSEIDKGDGWRLCMSPECEVIYFHEQSTLKLDAALGLPFHKGTSPERLVCFCFQHSVKDLQADLEEHGCSTLRDSIKASCKDGHDDCERKNPQGRCCLGNVGKVIKNSSAEHLPSKEILNLSEPGCDAEETDCCGAQTSEGISQSPPKQLSPRSGILASGGALAAAILSSACCWIPFVAIGLGASSAGLGAFFEIWRVPLLSLTFVLLSAGFYLVYRKPKCAPGEACAIPNRRLQLFNRSMLWGTAMFVAAFAFFPEYVSSLSGGGGQLAAASAQQTTIHYKVKGMTCAACEVHTKEAIEALPGVASVAVSHSDASADIIWDTPPDHAAVSEALKKLGYKAHPNP